jgi:hypothetical protein
VTASQDGGPPDPRTPEVPWEALAHDDPTEADRAARTLVRSPKTAALLARVLRPLPPADAERVGAALKDLSSATFAERERAERVLASAGEAAEPAVREYLRRDPADEAHGRAERLLARWDAARTRFLGVIRSGHCVRVRLRVRGRPYCPFCSVASGWGNSGVPSVA